MIRFYTEERHGSQEVELRLQERPDGQVILWAKNRSSLVVSPVLRFTKGRIYRVVLVRPEIGLEMERDNTRVEVR